MTQHTPMSRAMSAAYGSANRGGALGLGQPMGQLAQRSRSFAMDGSRHQSERSMYLDFERADAGSPSSDNILFDHMCYATTPSSSNGNSDMETALPPPPPPGMSAAARMARAADQAGASSGPTSPTSRLLLEYEMHLRNTLAKGMDAESCSLHTFEALLSQSMEDLGECRLVSLSSLSFGLRHSRGCRAHCSVFPRALSVGVRAPGEGGQPCPLSFVEPHQCFTRCV